MVGIETAVRLLGGVVLLLANGFFVTTEFAMTRVPQFPEEEFTESGSRGLQRAWDMTNRLEVYLSGCQVGITISSVGLGVVAEPGVAAAIDALFGAVGLVSPAADHAAISVITALALINLAHVVIGEQVPTYLGVERTKFIAKYCAPVLAGWTKLMWPVIVSADWLAKRILGLFGVTISRSWQEAEEEELGRGDVRSEMGRILSQGSVPRDRREEVMNALEIGTTPISEILVPRSEMVALSTDQSVDDALDTIRANPQFSRFPLFEGPETGQNVAPEAFVGVVHIPAVLRDLDALLDGADDLRDVATPPTSMTADTAISDAIDQFQAENSELALVLDAGGEVVGLVTASDAFEAITGELDDPLDRDA